MSSGISRRLLDSTGAKGTVATWSEIVESYEAVPDKFKGACTVLRDRQISFPYVVFAPPIVESRRKTTEKLLAIIDDDFFIWEAVGDRIVTTVYPLSKVTDIEVGEILLYSWLTITGTNAEGMVTATRIVYNTVSVACYKPFVDHFRPSPVDMDEVAWVQEQTKFDFLKSEHFKFMNYGYGILIQGERIHEIIWQPQIRRPLIALFGHSFYRTVTVAHMAILTDSEVILIGDDKRRSDMKAGEYGGIWQYIPLRHVASALVAPQSNDILVLSIHLDASGRQLDKIFAAVNQPNIEQFLRALQGLGVTSKLV